MTVEIKTAGKAEINPFIHMLVAGHESALLAEFYLQAPNVLVASASAPLGVLAAAGAKYVTITSEDDLFALKVALEGTAEEREARLGFPVDTLVIDSLDEFQRLMLVRRLEKERRVDTVSEDWQWISNRLNRIFTGLNNLELNVLSVTHLANVHESTAVKPNIQGAFCNQVHNYVEYALLLETRDEVLEPKEVAVKSSTDEVEMELQYDTELRRTLVTVPVPDAPWIHDDTRTLDRFIDLTFDGDFDRIVEARQSLVVGESSQVVIEDEPEVPEPEETVPSEVPVAEADKEPEIVEAKAEVKGMSSHDAIKAKLLGKKS